MRKLFFLLIIVVMAACASEPQYVVDGTLEGVDNQTTVYLRQRKGGQWVGVDSTSVTEGKFSFTGQVQNPGLYYIMPSQSRGAISLFLENSNITLKAHADSLYDATVTGSATHDEFEAFNESLDQFNNQSRELYARYREAKSDGDEETAKELEEKMNEIYAEMQDYQKDYVAGNPTSYVTPTVLYQLHYSLSADELNEAIAGLDTSLINLDVVKGMKEHAQKLSRVAVGQIAPDFTQNDPEGNPVTLSDHFGKILLVDFWAAWCGPCRAENPNIVAVYNDYKDKGFDVFGVSLDRTREEWVQAIEDDNLDWTHVSDLKFWENEAADMYAIKSIPSSVLLDKDGTIIAKNLRGDELRAKVSELLD